MKLIKQRLGLKWSCRTFSGFVYHYSNNFTTPRHVNLIDILAFPPIPDLINHQPNSNKCNKIPYFPHLCGLAPPQGTSQHWIHSVIYNWLLCHKCCIGPTQGKWTMSKSFSRDYIPPFLHLHICSKLSKSHSSGHVIIQALAFTHSFTNQNGGCVLCQWAVWLTICSC